MIQNAKDSNKRKQEMVMQLEQYFAKIDARREPISPEEAEAIIDEAMRTVRPSYRRIGEDRSR